MQLMISVLSNPVGMALNKNVPLIATTGPKQRLSHTHSDFLWGLKKIIIPSSD